MLWRYRKVTANPAHVPVKEQRKAPKMANLFVTKTLVTANVVLTSEATIATSVSMDTSISRVEKVATPAIVTQQDP